MNGAGNWTASGSSLPPTQVQALTLDPSNPNTLYVAAIPGVYKSTDGGAQWQLTGQANPATAPTSVLSVAVDPKTPSTIYATTLFAAVYKSTNSGQSYEIKSLPASNISQVLIDPVTTTTLYAATGNGVFRSQNGGDTWTALNTGLNRFGGGQPPRVNRLVSDPNNSLILYADTTFGAYRTTNGGAQWQAINNGLGQASGIEVLTLMIDPASPQTLYAGTAGFNGGLYKTVDGGAAWFASNAGLFVLSGGQLFPLGVRALALDPTMPMTLYAGTDGGVYKSTNGAASWEASNSGMPALPTLALALDRSSAQTLYVGVAGGNDGFVAKLNASGAALGWLTYLGGSLDDQARGIVLDKNGNVYVAGGTNSNNFPTANALQATPAGATDAFITKLDPAGSALIYSTYFGGLGTDLARGLAVNDAEQVYFAGTTGSPNLPVKNPLQPALGGSSDAFVAKLNAAGTATEYATWLGGQSVENGTSIAIDGAGNAYVAGDTASTNFPAVDAVQPQLKGPSDVFVAKLNLAGAALLYSTYLGGDARELANAIAVDGVGNTYVVGDTGSNNFPIAGALQPMLKAQNDAFLCKLGVEADLAVTQTPERNPVMVNNNLTITLAVNNRGPSPATGVVLTDSLPSGAGFVSATASQGGCAQSGGTLTCNLDNLAVNAAVTVTLIIRPTATGTINNAANVRATEPDGKQANNQTSGAITVSSLPSIAGRIADAAGKGLGGVSVALTGAQSKNALTNNNGVYQLANLQLGGNYTVTPTLLGYSFEPPARSFNNLAADATADFVATTCAYAIAPANQSFGATGGSGMVNVTATPHCAWSALSQVDWVTITAGATGSGNGAVSFTVQPASAPRVGRLIIARQTFVIYQGVDACATPPFFSATYPGVRPPSPLALATADFDGDGGTDLALLVTIQKPDAGYPGIAIYRSSRVGSLVRRTEFETALLARALAAGDFNGDGKPDLVVLTYSFSDWQLLLNDGRGGFGPPLTFKIPQFHSNTSLERLFTGDLNRDGKTDLIVPFSQLGESGVWLAYGGNNGFGEPKVISLGAQVYAVGDVNNDGVSDLLTNGLSSNYEVELRAVLGDGAGGFKAPVATSFNRAIRKGALGDFNGDGKLDAVLSMGTPVSGTVTEGDEVAVWLGDGTGRFTAQPKTEVLTIYSNLVVGDFNNDAKLDVGLPSAYQFRVLPGDGAGRLGAPQLAITRDVPALLSTGDFNGDGKLDLAGLLSGYDVTAQVFYNQCSSALALYGRVSEDGSGLGVSEVDITLTSGSLTRTRRTDSGGYYNFAGLPPGDYTLTAELSSFSFTPPRQTIVNLSASREVNWLAERRLVAVNSASYAPTIAPQSIATAFSAGMTRRSEAANRVPLPSILADAKVTLYDALAAERPVRLFFVSPQQINFVVPPGVAPGPARLVLRAPGANGAELTSGTLQIETVAPGLYSADASGRGIATGLVLRVKSDGTQNYEPLAQFEQNRFIARPIDLSNPQEQVYLLLFGTGIRNYGSSTPRAQLGGIETEVTFAGPQGELVGVDQVNLRLPSSLATSLGGRGEVEVSVTLAGKTSNAVRLAIKANPTLAGIPGQPRAQAAPPGPDLALTTSVAFDRATPGGRVAWLATIKNLGGDATNAAACTVTLPASVSLSNCAAEGLSCMGTGATRTLTLPPLKAGETRHLLLSGTVGQTAAPGTVLTATATLMPGSDDLNPNNHNAAATVRVVPASELLPPKANGKLVFGSDRGFTGSTEPSGTFLLNADGSGELFLLGIGGGAVWSPDGTRLAYYGLLQGSGPIRSGIFVSKPDGTERLKIAEDPDNRAQLSWSPDSTKVLYTGPNGRLFVANADGSGYAVLPNSPDLVGGSDWSPDGISVAYTKYPHVYVMNLDGTEKRQVSVSLGFNDAYYGPRWSPDGARLLFTRHTNNTEQVYLVNADGTGFSRALNAVWSAGASWSPDGTKIVYLERNALYITDFYFGGLTPLTRNRFYNFSPHWQPLPTTVPPPAPPAQTFTISGKLSLPDFSYGLIEIKLSGTASATFSGSEAPEYANANSRFLRLPAGGTYTLTPISPYHTFDPPSRTYTNLNADITGADFVSAPKALSIQGRIVDQRGLPMVGVTVSLGFQNSLLTETDADGKYEFKGLGSYLLFNTVFPLGYGSNDLFDPAYVTFPKLEANRTADFAGFRERFTITGQAVNSTGAPLSGATINVSSVQAAVNVTATSGADGRFTLTNLPGYFSYTVSAAKTGVTFNPAQSQITLNRPLEVNFSSAAPQ
jgi:uncharacterized protein (TIGR03437 family)